MCTSVQPNSKGHDELIWDTFFQQTTVLGMFGLLLQITVHSSPPCRVPGNRPLCRVSTGLLAHWLPLGLDKGNRGRRAESGAGIYFLCFPSPLCWLGGGLALVMPPPGTSFYSRSSCQLPTVTPCSCPLTPLWVQDVLLLLAPRCFIIPYQFLSTVST